MMKLFYLIPAIILVLFFSGCEENENINFSSEIDYVKYGTSFGECLGYCKNDIVVTASKIDFHKSGWNLEGVLPKKTKTENIDELYWTGLFDKIDFNSFVKLDSVIGCPDCADGGAEWIEIKSKGNEYKIIFEYNNAPEEVKDYVGYLRTFLNTFQVDANENVDFNKRTVINQSGFVRNFVATRGSYQWLIGIKSDNDTAYYFDKYLDAKYQQDNLKIEFNGVFNFDSTMIYKPAPNDIPISDFKARNITTFDIKIVTD